MRLEPGNLVSSLPKINLFLLALLVLVASEPARAANSNNLCQNAWKYPPNCQGNCTYQLVWRFRPADDTIEFIVSSRHANRWTGVGFAQDKSLKNSDAIFAWIEENSRYVMMDAFLPSYASPISDKQQSISNISATVSNGLISFRFIRKRNTSDPEEDLVFGDERCLYLIYPVEGGSVDLKNRAVVTDEYAPQISEQPVCIRACNYKPPSSSPSRPQLHFPSPQRANAKTSTTPAPASSSSRAPAQRHSASTTSTSPSPPVTTTSSPSSTPSSTTTTTSTTSTTTTTTSTTPRPSTTSTAPPQTTTSSTTTTTSTTTSTTSAPVSSTSAPVTSTTTAAPASEIPAHQQWCVGRWAHPAGCRFQGPGAAETLSYLQQPVDSLASVKPLPLDMSDCSYFAQWQYLEASDTIEFIIQTKTRNKWTGIGFSNSTRMANSDAIIGLIEEQSGRHFIMDTWLRDHVMPEIDSNQNTESTFGKRENGVTTVRFRRKRITGDEKDFQFTDDSCAYFLFPTQGGTFNAINKRMHKHDMIPSVSRQRICLKSCTRSSSTPTTSEQTPTSQPEVGEQSSSGATSQAPNLFLLSSSSAPNLASMPAPTTELPSNNLAPNNELNVELDSASTSSTSASSNHNSSPFNKLAFLSEPSLRWLAGIGCVATLLAMIVFQACFTVYKNKQACKQNLYRQSAFKQNAYLHGAYLADHAHSQQQQQQHQVNTTGASLDDAASQAASLHAAKLADAGLAQALPVRSRPQAQRQAKQHQPVQHQAARPLVPPVHPFAAHQQRANYADFATPSATESSEQEEDEELDEVDEEDEFEDDMMDDPFEYNHRLAYHNHRHPYHQQQAYHAAQHAHHHPHHHQVAQHPHRGAQTHYRQPSHYHAPGNQLHAHRARSQPHQSAGHQPGNQSRPDSYFLPSQRRY